MIIKNWCRAISQHDHFVERDRREKRGVFPSIFRALNPFRALRRTVARSGFLGPTSPLSALDASDQRSWCERVRADVWGIKSSVRFLAAAERFRGEWEALGPVRVEQLIRGTYISLCVSAVLLLIAAAFFGLWMVDLYQTGDPVFFAVMPSCAMAVVFTLYFSNLLYRIDLLKTGRHKLHPFVSVIKKILRLFFRNPDKKTRLKDKSSIVSVLISVGLLVGFFPETIVAADTTNLLDDFVLKSTDLGYQLLNSLFGMHSPTDEATGSVSAGMSMLIAGQAIIFNTVVLTGMAVLISVSMGTAIIHTSYEGMPLGKKVHTIWGPVRIAITILALAPMPGAGGFSVIQSTVVGAAYPSFGMASYMAQKGLDQMGVAIEEGLELDPRAQILDASVEQMVGALLDMLVITHYADSREAMGVGRPLRAWKEAGFPRAGFIRPATKEGVVRKITENISQNLMVDAPIQTANKTIIYEIWAWDRVIQEATWPSMYRLSGDHEKDGEKYYTRLGSVSIQCETEQAGVCAQRQQLLESLITDVSIVAHNAVWNTIDWRDRRQQQADAARGTPPDIRPVNMELFYSRIIDFQTQYRAVGINAGAMREKAKIIHEALKARVDRDGFMMLGATHIGLSRILETISKQAGALPGGTLHEFEDILEEYTQAAAKHDHDSAPQFQDMVKNLQAIKKFVINRDMEQIRLAGDGNEGLANQYLYKMIGAPFSVIPNFMEVGIGEDPLLRLQNTGHGLIAALEAAVVARMITLASAKAAQNAQEAAGLAAGGIPVVGGAAEALWKGTVGTGAAFLLSIVESIADIAGYLMIMLWVPALAMAYYLPAVPMILWTIAIAGMIITLVESVFAAPIWAAAHASQEGDGLMGVHARAGYMLVMGVLLRPSLMVISFFVSFELMDLVLEIFNRIFDLENKALAVGHISGIVSFIAMLYLYVLIVIALEHKIFGLITWLPDNVIRWAGQTLGSQLGGEAQHGVSGVGSGLQQLPGGQRHDGHGMGKSAGLISDQSTPGSQNSTNSNDDINDAGTKINSSR